MSGLHIYTTHTQPATRWRLDVMPRGKWIQCKPRRTFRTTCCRKRRWAKYLHVKAYYDCTQVFCNVGHGCRAERSR